MPNKLCPFNKMAPCVGPDCAMYLDMAAALDTNIGGEKLLITKNSKEIFNPPCALIVSAFSSFYIYSIESAKREFRNHLTKS